MWTINNLYNRLFFVSTVTTVVQSVLIGISDCIQLTSLVVSLGKNMERRIAGDFFTEICLRSCQQKSFNNWFMAMEASEMERCLAILVNRVDMGVHLSYQELDDVLITANTSVVKRGISILIGFAVVVCKFIKAGVVCLTW